MTKRTKERNTFSDQPHMGAERRVADRSQYDASVAMSVLRPDNQIAGPIVVQAVDISVSGIAILSRQMMHPGTIGALHMLTAGGRTTVVGVKVVNCQYVGEMKHRVGMHFTELHERFAKSPNMASHCRVLESRLAHRAFKKTVEGSGA